MARLRPKTDMYLACVDEAVARPGRWVSVPHRFESEFNASVTASCLRDGYLRVRPRDGDTPTLVQGQRYIRTAAPVEVQVHQRPDGWALTLRADKPDAQPDTER